MRRRSRARLRLRPELLARQVEGTLRHEVAHHLGYDEPGVAALGL